ncbi:MAG: radical SAM protein [Bdellovibrionales bacterium]|nr:radical SAM protein [Bdellovibrionales bacterium]
MDADRQKNFCDFLSRGIFLSPNKITSPCCRFDWKKQDSLAQYSPSEASKVLHELDRTTGVDFPKGCWKCKREEDSGVKSLREGFPLPEAATGNYVEVVVGNICNLRCVGCKPSLSSSWQKEYAKLGLAWAKSDSSKAPNKNGHFEIDLPFPISKIEKIKITGGEPFLSKEFENWLQLTAQDVDVENVEIEIYTNCTITPKPETIVALSRFKRVTIRLSIDGYGELNRYLRFPAEWGIVESVFHHFIELSKANKNISTEVAITVGTLNAMRLVDLFEFISRNSSDVRILTQLIHEPEYLNPRTTLSPLGRSQFIATLEEAQNIVAKLPNLHGSAASCISKVKTYLSSTANQETTNKIQLKQYLEALSRTRDLDYLDFFKTELSCLE